MDRSFRTKKSLGQYFLVNPQVARKVVDAAHVDQGDVVLEIGCGPGALTELLLARADRVIGVEIDRRLGAVLKARFASRPGFLLLEQDILEVDIRQVAQSLGGSSLVVVGTIPYHLTSPILFKLLDHHSVLDRAVLTTQREVAERLVAKPGPNYSLLALAVQLKTVPRVVGHIGADAFQPRPKVESSIVRLDFAARTGVLGDAQRGVLRLARAGFAQRRKMLRNSLLNVPLSKSALAGMSGDTGIELSRRAETLSLEEWVSLAHAAGL
jgi:16S rRNA (adenine1518-N6/adenine1519-N6)-dimethyltransferase